MDDDSTLARMRDALLWRLPEEIANGRSMDTIVQHVHGTAVLYLITIAPPAALQECGVELPPEEATPLELWAFLNSVPLDNLAAWTYWAKVSERNPEIGEKLSAVGAAPKSFKEMVVLLQGAGADLSGLREVTLVVHAALQARAHRSVEDESVRERLILLSATQLALAGAGFRMGIRQHEAGPDGLLDSGAVNADEFEIRRCEEPKCHAPFLILRSSRRRYCKDSHRVAAHRARNFE